MAYLNPYGDDSSLDPDAARRKALLDLMGTPAQGATPTASQALPSSRPAPIFPTGTTRATAANGADTPDLPDPPAAAATSPAVNPYTSTDNGLQYGSKILDLYSEPYNRRGGGTGGIGSGALTGASIGSTAGPIGAGVGAAVGAIVGAARKHAETAPTDFSVNDAREIVRGAWRDMFGREATDQEVNDALAGQGLKAGGEWVGQQGLMGVLGHLGENAAAERAAGGGTAASATSAGATPGGALASNPNTGFAGGMNTSVSGPSGATGGGGGGVPGNVEGVDAGKWSDPNKHDPKYDVLHLLAQYGSLDAALPEIQKLYPNAKKVGGDAIDMGDGVGPVDIQRDSDHGGPFHWEPVSGAADQSAASSAPVTTTGSSPLASPGAAQLAAPLGNNDVLQQIMEELRRIQSGEAPRNALLQQMGLA
ncbi:MAG TPA: hypothetical protein VHP62_01725 [Usitatibacter sp.]|jgi:hypothetical protein|nr:hypothetical protein [Usitatibacter sp.]